MDRRAIVAQIGCAAQLSDAALDALAAGTVLRRVEHGTIVTLEGEPAAEMYLVAAGRVKIVRYSMEGREYIVRVAEAADLFNTVPMLDGGSCPATSMALEPTILLVLVRADLLDLVERYPDLVNALLHEFAGRLRMFMDLVDALVLHTVHGRVATLLLRQEELADERGVPPSPMMTQSEMAAHLGAPYAK